jgi:hypothetical protein
MSFRPLREELKSLMGIADSIIKPCQFIMYSSMTYRNDYLTHYVAYDGFDPCKIRGVYLHHWLETVSVKNPPRDAVPGELIWGREQRFD